MSSTRPGDARAASANDAAELLQGNEPGVLLVGPAAQTSHAIRLILDRLSDQSVMPVGFAASGATPAMLRQEVGQAHAARPSPDTDLLLVVAQADRLSPDLLHELEMAAAAAATHGGLKFLFAAPRDLTDSLQRAELWSLAACVRTCLPILPPARPADRPPEQPERHAVGQVAGRPYPFDLLVEPLGVARHAQPARSGPRIMLAVGILGALGLALTGMLVEHQSARSVMPITRTPAPVIAAPAAPVPPAPAPTTAPLVDSLEPPAPPTDAEPTTVSPPPPPSAPSASVPSSLPSPPPAPPPASPVAAAPQQQPADAVPAVPTKASPAAVDLPSDRIDAGQIVPQMSPARHASLLLLAGPDDTLSSLYAQVYRGTTPPPYAQVVTLNPVVHSGVRLVFPAPSAGWPAASP